MNTITCVRDGSGYHAEAASERAFSARAGFAAGICGGVVAYSPTPSVASAVRSKQKVYLYKAVVFTFYDDYRIVGHSG